MRVLHIISGDLWAGAEVQAFTLLTSLQEMKDVTIASVLLNDGILAEKLRAAGISVEIASESELGAPRLLWKLRQILAQWRPDVVHTHRDKENILGSLANRTSVNGICVRTAHGQNEHGHRSGIDRLDRWCAVHLQQGVIAVTQELAATLAFRMPKARVIIVENGVDMMRVRAQVHPVDFALKWPQARHVGIVGRLVAVKRIDIFLEVAALLLRERTGQQWVFHVIGDGGLRSMLQQRAATLGLGDSVIFHGHRPDSIACLAQLDALVMCSDHEGLPMTALEAICVGTPVIAHAVGGLKEIIISAAHGVLIADNKPERYAAALKAQVSVPRIQAGALPEKYSAHENALRIHRFYEDLRSARHGR